MFLTVLAIIAGIFAVSTAAVVYLAVRAPSVGPCNCNPKVGCQLAGPKGRHRCEPTVSTPEVFRRPRQAR